MAPGSEGFVTPIRRPAYADAMHGVPFILSRLAIAMVASVVLLACAGRAWSQPASDPQPWIDAVQAVFAQRCDDCHSPDGSRSARGAWADASDLAQLRDSYVSSDDQAISDIEQTTLWIVLHEEPDFRMPPPGADTGDLTAAEFLVVRRWLELGAPLPGSLTATDAEDAAVERPDESLVIDIDPETLSTAARLRRWLGRLHPPAVHLPIGLLLAAGLAELLVAFTGGRYFLSARRFCMAVACLAALGASLLGWFAGEFARPSDTLTLHRWSGITLAALLLIVTALGERAAQPDHVKTRRAFRIGLVACLALVTWVGHLGGVMVFGEGYLAW